MLKGRLLTLDFEPVMGVFSATLNAKLMVEFSLCDQQSHEILWKEVIVANGSQRSGSMFSEDFIRPAFNQAMDNLIRQLLASEGFSKALL